MLDDLGRIVGLWRGRAIRLSAGVILSLAALLAALGLLLVIGASTGSVIAAGVLVAPLLPRVFGTARVVLRYAERLVTHDAMFRALSDVRVWFFRRLAATGAGGLGYRQAGDVLSRAVSDVETLDGLYVRLLIPLAGAIVLPPILALLIGTRAPLLALVIGALFILAAFVLPWLAAKATMASGARLAAALGGLRIAALDALTGLREVRAFGAEGRMLALVQAREAALLAAQHALAGRAALAGAGSFLCAQAALFAVLLAASRDPATAVAAAFILLAGFEAVGGLPRAGVYAGHAAAAARRVLEAADTPVPVPDPAHPAAMPASGALRFEGVGFSWQANRPRVFDGLSLDIPQGARVALLGPSGSGKSTLAALLLKAAAPHQGRILLGGTDIATLPADAVRQRITMLNQATHLFDDTIRANLLLARPGADDAALWEALEAARIAELVRALPDGLDTWVGEGGARFSGGQGRRLALARALLSPAPILILDEPCAGLDAEVERAFLMTLNDTAPHDAMRGRTVILIAHRLTGVERLDRIFRLSGGRAIAAAG